HRRHKIQARSIRHPRRGLPSSPIEGILLTGADVDAIAGLLHLRERQPFTIYARERVLAVPAATPIFGVLAEECGRRWAVPLGTPFTPCHLDGSASGLE